MTPQRRNVARRALDAALDVVPGAVVERVTAASAPLARYSGRTSAGAGALSSALRVLAQPPRRRRRPEAPLSLEEVSALSDEPLEVVRAWAERGLLGEPPADGRWPAATLDRAALLSFALRRGVPESEIEEAAASGRLPLLMLEQALAGDTPLSATEVAERAGVPLELTVRIWRALGMPADDLEQPLYTRDEVAALRVIGAMRSVFTEDDLLEAASVVGRAMAEISSAATELFRRRLTARYLEAGVSELELSLRLAAMTDLLLPPLGPLLEVALRRHLSASTRHEAALQLELSAGSPESQRELSVVFADLVGFASASERLSALEVGQLAARLLHCAEAVLPRHGARIVKSIGDAVMFTARDPLSAASAGVELIAACADEDLPPVRAGAAHGTVLHAYADYFGRTVNIASRLCDAAGAGALLLHTTEPVAMEAWQRAGLRAEAARIARLKGIQGRLHVLRVSAAHQPPRPQRPWRRGRDAPTRATLAA